MWPVYARVLEETFVAAMSPREAEAAATALARAHETAKTRGPSAKGLRDRASS